MATIIRISLTTRYPFHFGRRGVGLNETEVTLAADALFSAMCNSMFLLEGDQVVQDMLATFPTFAQPATPPFRITSLMPSKAGIDLLPMPALRISLPGKGLEARKEIKSIRWVSRSLFQRLVRGEALNQTPAYVEPNTNRLYTVQNGEVWVSKNEQEALGGEDALLWATAIRPRVTVDRISSQSNVFSSGSVHFAKDVSLYALIRWEKDDSTLQDRVEAAFRALGDDGIGGERAYGYGHFEPDFTASTDDLGATAGNYFTTLSPYLPQQNEREVFGGFSSYAIDLRRGWITRHGYNNLRRPTLRMVESASVLHKPKSATVTGCLGDVTPSEMYTMRRYTVYRYGLAWPVTVADSVVEPARESI